MKRNNLANEQILQYDNTSNGLQNHVSSTKSTNLNNNFLNNTHSYSDINENSVDIESEHEEQGIDVEHPETKSGHYSTSVSDITNIPKTNGNKSSKQHLGNTEYDSG